MTSHPHARLIEHVETWRQLNYLMIGPYVGLASYDRGNLNAQLRERSRPSVGATQRLVGVLAAIKAGPLRLATSAEQRWSDDPAGMDHGQLLFEFGAEALLDWHAEVFLMPAVGVGWTFMRGQRLGRVFGEEDSDAEFTARRSFASVGLGLGAEVQLFQIDHSGGTGWTLGTQLGWLHEVDTGSWEERGSGRKLSGPDPRINGFYVRLSLTYTIINMMLGYEPRPVEQCSGTLCELECEPGHANCDGFVYNGCEADLTARDHCGECEARCSNDEQCVRGACRPH